MAIVSYTPWSAMQQMQDEINRAFSRVTNDADADTSAIVNADWAPAVDIREEDERFVLHADIPGVDPAQIEVSMDNGVLTIRGERNSNSVDDKDGYKRIERSRGTFYRRFALPDTADAQKVTARGEHGVLEVLIPKVEKEQARRITVEA